MRLLAWIVVTLSSMAALPAPAARMPTPAPATIEATQTFPFNSQINAAHYKLTVVLPPTYAQSPNKHYPVLYLMDGDAMTLLAAYALPRMEVKAVLPEMIIVGVGYPGASERDWDYAPLSQTYWKMPLNRGAEQFIRVLKEEIVPFVDDRYRTVPSNRGIGGHSLGGLLSAYALVHASDTFNHFWISSASLFWDEDKVLSEATDFMAHHPDPSVRVFADVGGEESSIMQGSVERLQQTFETARWTKSAFHLEILSGEVHTTVPSTVFADAMTFLYDDRGPGVKVPRDRLAALSGIYRLPNGKTFTLRSDDRDLYMDGYGIGSATVTNVRLTATSPNQFYSRMAELRLQFTDQPGEAPRLDVVTAREQSSATKVSAPR
jgi:predicted alpha/beta superfamily hydrolase